MIALYHAPRTRSVRIVWLLEELGLRYELRRVAFEPPERTFSQKTPLGKLPVLVDGEITICESGAILQYVLERHGGGRLAPAPDSPLRGPFLQWVHFAESTAQSPLGTLIWHTLYKRDADRITPSVLEHARDRARDALAFVERQLGDQDYLLGAEFSGADVMMGFTLVAARVLGVLDEHFPGLARYLARLEARPAFQRAVNT